VIRGSQGGKNGDVPDCARVNSYVVTEIWWNILPLSSALSIETECSYETLVFTYIESECGKITSTTGDLEQRKEANKMISAFSVLRKEERGNATCSWLSRYRF
jgi:hypothetical protein